MEAITASLDISPESLLATACYGPRNLPSKRMVNGFEANILILRDGSQLLLIVSLDWFFVSPTMRNTILQACGDSLKDANVVVAASHTHTSPNTDVTKTGFSTVDETYVSEIENRIAIRIRDLLQTSYWQGVQTRFMAVPCDSSIHRRRAIWWPRKYGLYRKMTVYPNPNGERDRELRLLRVEKQDGTPLAVMWGISCHPTEWPRIGELSSDYPGIVRESIRKQLNASVPILFLQGFSGDLRPPSTGYWLKRASTRIRILMFFCSLVNGKCFAGFSEEQYRGWTGRLCEAAGDALKKSVSQPTLASRLSLKRLTMPISAIGLEAEPGYLSMHLAGIGEHLSLVSLSAEVVWSYTGILKQIAPGHAIWPVGCADHVFGYLPDQSMVGEGGYEVVEFKTLFGVKGEFNANTESAVRSCLENLFH